MWKMLLPSCSPPPKSWNSSGGAPGLLPPKPFQHPKQLMGSVGNVGDHGLRPSGLQHQSSCFSHTPVLRCCLGADVFLANPEFAFSSPLIRPSCFEAGREAHSGDRKGGALQPGNHSLPCLGVLKVPLSPLGGSVKVEVPEGLCRPRPGGPLPILALLPPFSPPSWLWDRW